MKYIVTTRFHVTGTFTIEADSPKEAEEIVERDCGFVSGVGVHTSNDLDVRDWKFDTHLEKEILSTKKKNRK